MVDEPVISVAVADSSETVKCLTEKPTWVERLDQSTMEGKESVPSFGRQVEFLFLSSKENSDDSGIDESGSVHIEHVLGGCSGVHWGGNSAGFSYSQLKVIIFVIFVTIHS